MTTARIRRRQQAASRREEELADGHAEMRFAGYVAVSAPSAEELERSESEVEHAAPARPPRAAAPLRRAGRRLRLHPAALPGAAMRQAAPQSAPATAPPPPTSRPPTPSSPRAASAPPAPTSAATPTAAPGSMTRGCSTSGGMLPGPNMLVLGQIGRGKSAFVKTYLYRQAVFGRQAWVLDPKGEYAPLARALGVEPIAPGARRRGPAQPAQPARRARGPAQPPALGRAGGAAPRARAPRRTPACGWRWTAVSAERERGEPTLPRWSTRCCAPREEMVAGARPASRERFAEANRSVGAGAAAPLRGRPARHVRRADHAGPRPRRAARRPRPVRRAATPPRSGS